MGVTSLLSRYIGRQFLGGFLGVMLVLTGFIWLVEFVELVRRVGGRPGGTVGQAFELSRLKTPETLEMVFPFAILFAAMFTFWRLTRSRELIVTRAAGISAWQFLLPVLLSAFVIGVFRVTLLN